MAGRNQREAIRRGLQCGTFPTPTGRFRSYPARKHPDRIECTICGMTGYGPLEPDCLTAFPWQLSHMLDHPFACALCPARFMTVGQHASHTMREHGCQ